MLSVIIPTFNEKENLSEVFSRIEPVLEKIPHEIIVVDDNSPDGTSEYVKKLSQLKPHIRIIKRYHRRGLSSACIEGMLCASGNVLAVMDADLQHDETILPNMYHHLQSNQFDVIIGSRFITGARVDGLVSWRQKLSHLGIYLSNFFLSQKISDPMSGFFMIKAHVFEQSLPHLSPMGFKILFDILISYPKKDLKLLELPFIFRKRFAGNSKLDSHVLWEFFIFLLERLFYRKIPGEFISFSIIGSFGVLVHLMILKVIMLAKASFFASQVTATALVISLNFLLNNKLTYRTERIHGKNFIYGLLSFYLVCSIGAFTNVGVASYLFDIKKNKWWVSAILGIIVGTFWNYEMSRIFTWKSKKR